eukprot:CAMPEP_0184014772 /NCGR_PEP_ID=MMETSP0954-20121128/5894_1 /TAXON_ID=627963 /ORGANISM="Aplanochytrium sp, Strain PBS07" /LENGTH=309 /DNA_ID=CAMNT_0026295389 /DNA_START=127 /DNA_END=1053 /DNA_ORIENTATION=-
MLQLLPQDLAVLCASFCSGKDLVRLVCTCRELNNSLIHAPNVDEVLWKQLYLKHAFNGKRPRAPSFPTAGSWRDVYIRAVSSEVCLVVHSLSADHKRYTITVPRHMSLYALKKEIRSLQLKYDCVALEDFELVSAKSGHALGLQGNDSLPPSDLGFLFVTRQNLIRSRAASRLVERLLRTESRPAWRRSLCQIGDGTEFYQVFVGKRKNQVLALPGREELLQHPFLSVTTPRDPVLNPGDRGESQGGPSQLKLQFLDSIAFSKVQTLAQQLVEPSEQEPNSPIETFSELDYLLRQANYHIGYNAHKLYW